MWGGDPVSVKVHVLTTILCSMQYRPGSSFDISRSVKYMVIKGPLVGWQGIPKCKKRVCPYLTRITFLSSRSQNTFWPSVLQRYNIITNTGVAVKLGQYFMWQIMVDSSCMFVYRVNVAYLSYCPYAPRSSGRKWRTIVFRKNKDPVDFYFKAVRFESRPIVTFLFLFFSVIPCKGWHRTLNKYNILP